MNKGNDDLLFGQPKDLEEAVETLIAFCGEDEVLELVLADADSYGTKALNRIAELIRNHWFLWWHLNHDSRWFPASKPPLLAYFHQLGITHPDDMSSIIFSAIWHQLHDKPYDLAATVHSLQEYWKEQGFPDGKPDNHSI